MTLYCSQGHLNSSDSRFCRLCGEVLAVGGAEIAGQLLSLRYRVLSQLGQGGFGRTYLAEDTNRFNEACVLKEFAPQVEGEPALQKAEELFAREAGILYQLQHPQIPSFREMFRAEWQGRERIFLVQDYVEGQPYDGLLQQRSQGGDRFAEAEVVQLLLQLLPVLDYIHAAGVIHRDISPDNLIQRSSDGLPVLIDFGGVKQVAARVMSVTSPTAQPATVTRLGKVGYAPAEQLELGEVYPHSDLYALAVTVLVLVTGKEPGELFSRNGALDRYQWQREVALRPALVSILAKMLEPYPTKRYQSAQAVMQALNAAGYQAAAVPDRQPGNGSANGSANGQAGTPAGSPIPVFAPDPATIAVSPKGLPQPIPLAPKPVQVRRKGVGRTIATTLLLAGLIVGGWWAGVKWIGPALKSQLPEITKPSKPKPNPKPTQPQQSDFSKAEQERKQQVESRQQQLGIENAFLVRLVNEAFYAKHPELNGQKLGTGNEDADLRKEWDELALDYLKRLEFLSSDSRSRLGQFTSADVQERQTAASQINLSSRALNDLTDAAFFHRFPEQSRGENLLDREIGQVWQAVAADQLKLLQSGKTLERVQFPPGNFSDRLSGTLKPGEGKAYIANLSANQTLQLQLQAQSFLLSLYPPTSELPALLSDSRETQWSGKLTASGYYEIVVVSDGKDVNYAIDLAVADEVSSP
ncbi:MAG: protein kinase [Leptolyngbyaceae cyanobacterium bins.302]|nr:protein kinase [Leptolyngbyaceae cyanobacterium bins.302]